MRKKAKSTVGIRFDDEQFRELEKILKAVNGSDGLEGGRLTRSELVRVLIGRALEDMTMGDQSRTMRDSVRTPKEEDREAEEARLAEEASRRGKMSRAKGARFENVIAKEINEACDGADAKRGFQFRGGDNVPDVECPLLHIECKRGKRPNPRAALAQAIEGCPKGKLPIALIRDDRRETFAVMLWEDVLSFLSEWWEATNK
jgi:hypothetical protein